MTQGLRSADLDYPFDPRHIATRPAEPRDAARMMVVERASGAKDVLTGTDKAELAPGDAFVIETPGGGGYGAPR